MRHFGIGIGLFSASTVLSTMLWFANAPDFSLGQPSFSIAPSKEVVINDATFIKQMKASLKQEAVTPPVKQRWVLQNASLNKGAPRQPEEARGLLVNASYVSSYGVNEWFIQRACAEYVQQSPQLCGRE
jgi:hypothetical protein